MAGIDKKTWVLAGLALLIAVFFSFSRATAPTEIDFVHYQTMLRFQRDMGGVSIYEKNDHPEIFETMLRVAEATPDPNRDESSLATLMKEQKRFYPQGLHPTGSPFLYAAWGCVSLGDFDADLFRYQLFNNFLFSFGLLLVFDRLLERLTDRTGREFMFLLFSFWVVVHFFLLFRPLVIDLQVGNSNRLQAGLICVLSVLLQSGIEGFATRGKAKWLVLVAGVLLGGLFAYKPNVLGFVILLMFGTACFCQRRVAVFLASGFGVGLVASLAFAMIAFGDLLIWLKWQAYLSESLGESFPMEKGNYALVGLLSPQFVKSVSSILFCLLLMGGVLVAFKDRKKITGGTDRSSAGEPGQKLPGRATIVLAMYGLVLPLLTAPLAWGHYYVLALPAAFACIPSGGVWKLKISLWVFAILILSGVPVVLLTKSGLTISPLAVAIMLFLATVSVLFLLYQRFSELASEAAEARIAS